VYIVVLGPIKKDPLDVSDARFNKSETRLCAPAACARRAWNRAGAHQLLLPRARNRCAKKRFASMTPNEHLTKVKLHSQTLKGL
jgi:hypothetical protein